MTSNYRSNPSIFLLPGEKIVLKANPHWLFLIIPLAGMSIFFLYYLFFACPFLGIIYRSFKGICNIAALFVLIFLSVIFYFDWKFNRLYLTNLRLIKERGIIGKRYMTIKLIDIEDITCKLGFWGRIFGYGDLTIESAGTYGSMAFKGIPMPRETTQLIEKHMFFSSIK